MAVASLNPFDLASLDIRTSAAMDAGTVSPKVLWPAQPSSLVFAATCAALSPSPCWPVPELRNCRLERRFRASAVVGAPFFSQSSL